MDRKKIVIIALTVILVLITGAFTYNAAQSEDAGSLFEKAEAYFQEEDYETSIEYYLEYLNIDPGHLQARLGLAKAYFMLEEWGKVEHTLLQGIRLKPREPAYYITLADVYFYTGRIEEGIQTVMDGRGSSRSQGMDQMLEEITERLSIQSTRARLQQDYENPLMLVWDEDTTVDMDIEWTLESGSGEFSHDEEGQLFIVPEQTGMVTLDAAIESLTLSEDFEVAEQVLNELVVSAEDADAVEMSIGEEVTLSVTGFDLAEDEKDIVPEWSLDKELGTLSETEEGDIIFTAEKSGTETITAEADGLVSDVTIKVEGDDLVQVAYEVEGEGIVSLTPEPEELTYGTEITLHAEPAEGWTFAGWHGDVQSLNNPLVVTLEGDLSVTAVFTEEGSYDLSVGTDGSGSVLQDTMSYANGDTVTLTAVPDRGWEFVRWEGSVTGSAESISVIMDRDHHMTAVFSKEQEEAVENESSNTGGTETEASTGSGSGGTSGGSSVGGDSPDRQESSRDSGMKEEERKGEEKEKKEVIEPDKDEKKDKESGQEPAEGDSENVEDKQEGEDIEEDLPPDEDDQEQEESQGEE
ncbi:tetratricopeptide repeat protein [Bacillus sp. H-16]|uniref:InlB B-repeat-containing protein n=1 Tax=Alteribacter salitolerans TaxID=2912333 RepID=UPI0019637058|nr:tetratricopeptide repeat protein [Alteribacter salitolerans]MBM7095699.1 tetratricopeptide repeat protein [Alteribacter salitolerans]